MLELFLHLNAEMKCTYVRQVYIRGSIKCWVYWCQWGLMRTLRMLFILAVTTQRLDLCSKLFSMFWKSDCNWHWARFHEVSHPFSLCFPLLNFMHKRQRRYVSATSSIWEDGVVLGNNLADHIFKPAKLSFWSLHGMRYIAPYFQRQNSSWSATQGVFFVRSREAC